VDQPVEPLDAAAIDTLIAPARQALERGDYGRCQQLLAPLLVAHPASTAVGGQVRLLLATAQMGQGDSLGAAATCRSLRACRDATLRAQAKDLQEVLEAPALERPREWSMTLPTLGEMKPLEGQVTAMARRRRRLPPPPPAPPTGPTRAPLGFALVAIVLLLLTALLGGCVDLQTSMRFPAPGRVQLSQSSLSSTGRPLPWQRQLALELRDAPWQQRQDLGRLQLQAKAMPAAKAFALLSSTIERGAQLAALDLPPPQFTLQERNWLLGVHQRLDCQIDLRSLQPLPGLHLSVDLEPLPLRAVQRSVPLQAVARPRRKGQPPQVIWTLQPGAVNELAFSCWRWSSLGLGALLIALALALVALLQRLKLAAGFGWPQLPA
jgi:hypothetical protein